MAAVTPTAIADELGAYMDRLSREPRLSDVLEGSPTLAELAEALRITDVRAAAMARALTEVGAVRVGVGLGGGLPLSLTAPEERPERVALCDPRYVDPGLGDEEARPAEDPLARAVFARYLAGRGDDHYAALGVVDGADAGAVETAWLATSRDFHPDRFSDHPDGEVRERAKEVFMRAGFAFSVLADDARREAWLTEREARRSASSSDRMEAEAELARGEKRLVRGDAEGARQHFERARELAPGEPLYDVYLGWATFVAAEDDADRTEGERLLQRGVARDPSQPEGHELLAQLYARTGRGGASAEAAARAQHIVAQASRGARAG